MSSVITSDNPPSVPENITELFESVLIGPSDSCDELCILSGYATSSMMECHIARLRKLGNPTVRIRLIVGMVPKDGLPRAEHKGFQELVRIHPELSVGYLTDDRSSHSKMYVWLRSGKPVSAFIGSANYSQNAFLGRQFEAVSACDPFSVYEIFQKFEKSSVNCLDMSVESRVHIVSGDEYRRHLHSVTHAPAIGGNSVKLSLLTSKGEMGNRSSLNWGKREGRESNQAYIPIPANIGKSDFFPPQGQVFTVLTDDGHVFHCVTAQTGSGGAPKAIETPENNSSLGKYFRERLGVELGKFVTKEDLKNYGRTDVDFVRIGDGTYFMNFSQSSIGEMKLD